MNPSENLFKQLQESPDALLIIQKFQEYIDKEHQKRIEFYDLVHENQKAEFIQGEIIFHSLVRMRHLIVSSNIALELIQFVKQNQLGFVGIEKMMIELSRNCYEPDLVYFRKEIADSFLADQKLFPAPDLVVEILSESTKAIDYGIKFRDYAAHEVGEYWIVDPEQNKIEQYLLLEKEFYLHASHQDTGTLNSIIIPKFSMQVSKIFAS